MDYGNIKFLHVVRLDEIPDLITAKGDKYIFPKLDGTNATVWADNEGIIHAGSRNRELSIDKDNAGFYKHVMESDTMGPICQFCLDNPFMVVCGEWLGGKAGHIKSYLNKEFYVFDMKLATIGNIETGKRFGYLPYNIYSNALAKYGYQYIIPPLRVYRDGENVTVDDIAEIAESNHFNLPDDVVGEGVVVKNYNYISRFGNYEEGKIVRAEFKERKGQKLNKSIAENSNIEQAIVDDLVSSSDIQKCINKVSDILGEEFSKSNGKMVGIVMEMAFSDLLSEEASVIAKKYGKYPIVFSNVKKFVYAKARSVIGL